MQTDEDGICGFCGSSALTVMRKKDAKSGRNLLIGFCEQCALVQQVPMPTLEHLTIYYSHNYREDYKASYSPKSKHVVRAGRAAQERLGWLQRKGVEMTGKRLVDIGAGGGEFVYLARKAGFDAVGIEPNIGYSEFARTNYGVDVSTDMLSDLPESSVDVVTMFHVLEHMADPSSVVKNVWSALANNGLWIIEVPNILQVDASPHNIFFKAHIFYYSLETLLEVVGSCFELIWANSQGNLKVVLKKRETMQDAPLLIDQERVRHQFFLLEKKNWWSYIVLGGGWSKFFRNLSRNVGEMRYRKVQPKAILDLISLSSETQG